MAKLSKALKKLIENPDDLTGLPQIIEQVSNLEQEIDSYQERIVQMRELNKKYLAMVPITDDDPTDQAENKEEPATLADAREYLVQTLGGEQ